MWRFGSTLNYSSVNEDWRTELAALKPDDDGPILCVTGSGDRPLNLLAQTRAPTIAIDCNPAQNHLLRLKTAALSALSFEEYAAFLGLTDVERHWRRMTYRGLESVLPKETRRFWQHHQRQITRGVIYAGRFERHFRRVGRFARFIRGARIERLFAFDDVEQQRAFVRERWDTPAWQALFRLAVCPMVSRLTFGDPAFYRHAAVPIGETLYQRMCRALEQTLARECFMMGLVFQGRLPDADLPPYLTPAGAAAIRPRLWQLHIVDDELAHYLGGSDRPTFSRFSLSDVPSFLSEQGYTDLMRRVLGRAAPGARVVVRQFLSRHELPPAIERQLIRERALEETLAQQDRAFAYEFLVATAAGRAA